MPSDDYHLTIVESAGVNLHFICESCKSYYVFAHHRSLFYSAFGNFVFTVGESDGWWAADPHHKAAIEKLIVTSHGMIARFDPGFLLCPRCKESIPATAYRGIKATALLYHVMFDNEKKFEPWRVIMPPNYMHR